MVKGPVSRVSTLSPRKRVGTMACDLLERLGNAVLIKQGAESKVYKVNFLGRDAAIKFRSKKSYRNSVLDQKITSKRHALECRIIAKASKFGLDVPQLYYISSDFFAICMEFINGPSVKDFLNDESSFLQNRESDVKNLAHSIGVILWKMHQATIIHGDLTTSNLILRDLHDTSSVVLIDFGLSSICSLDEDKAVDLYVLERSIISSHPKHSSFFKEILAAYTSLNSSLSKSIIQKLDEVRLRGRKRTMIG